MSLTIAVLGASGVYARHLIPWLVARGFRVRALVRRPEAAGVARACGAEVDVADIFDGASLEAAVKGGDVGVNLATSPPRCPARAAAATGTRTTACGAMERRSGSRRAEARACRASSSRASRW